MVVIGFFDFFIICFILVEGKEVFQQDIMECIDIYFIYIVNGYKFCCGQFFFFGVIIVLGGVNFFIYFSYSIVCILVLFEKWVFQFFVEIFFLEFFCIGNVYCMVVFDLDFENLEYGYCMEGFNNFQQGYWFDFSKVFFDFYVKVVSGWDVWGI